MRASPLSLTDEICSSHFFVQTVRMIDMIVVMFKWWYSEGWKHAFMSVILRSNNMLEKFSVPILLKTLFEPWKQIKSYAGSGSSLNDKAYVLFDNAFARTFGFILRINLIIIAMIISVLVGLVSLVLAIVWPVIPFLPVVFVVLGLQSYV